MSGLTQIESFYGLIKKLELDSGSFIELLMWTNSKTQESYEKAKWQNEKGINVSPAFLPFTTLLTKQLPTFSLLFHQFATSLSQFILLSQLQLPFVTSNFYLASCDNHLDRCKRARPYFLSLYDNALSVHQPIHPSVCQLHFAYLGFLGLRELLFFFLFFFQFS